MYMIPFSVLDLCPVLQDQPIAQAFKDSAELAQLAEKLNFKRFWLAEHHNMPGIASAATSLAISHVANATNHIRVGSGGIMLPNHSPIVIAEQFGTLACIYGDRIDLGIGRAPGTDPYTSAALRRHIDAELDDFPEDVLELHQLLGPQLEGQAITAIPGVNTQVPIWLLGSSLYSASLAASLGLPFAFASHFAPDYLTRALNLYKSQFKPSQHLEKPYALAAIVAVVADTDEKANYQFSSMLQQTVAIHKNTPIALPLPCHDIDNLIPATDLAGARHSLAEAAVGSPNTVKQKIKAFIEKTQIDELMVTARIYDRESRLESLTHLADIRDALN